MDNLSFKKRFLNQLEYLFSTYFIPISLILEAMMLPYKNLRFISSLNPFWTMGIIYLAELGLWVIKEKRGDLDKKEVIKFSSTYFMFYFYMIFSMIITTLSFFNSSLACTFWLFIMTIGFMTKYKILQRLIK